MQAAVHSPVQVYLVEDSPMIRSRLVEMLGQLDDVRVVGEAETPADAIAGIRASVPDVVVLDLHLRNGSGLEVLRALQPDASGPLFIVLTNHPTEQYRKLSQEAGARHFLDKSSEFLRVNQIVAALGQAHCGSSHCTPTTKTGSPT